MIPSTLLNQVIDMMSFGNSALSVNLLYIQFFIIKNCMLRSRSDHIVDIFNEYPLPSNLLNHYVNEIKELKLPAQAYTIITNILKLYCYSCMISSSFLIPSLSLVSQRRRHCWQSHWHHQTPSFRSANHHFGHHSKLSGHSIWSSTIRYFFFRFVLECSRIQSCQDLSSLYCGLLQSTLIWLYTYSRYCKLILLAHCFWSVLSYSSFRKCLYSRNWAFRRFTISTILSTLLRNTLSILWWYHGV